MQFVSYRVTGILDLQAEMCQFGPWSHMPRCEWGLMCHQGPMHTSAAAKRGLTEGPLKGSFLMCPIHTIILRIKTKLKIVGNENAFSIHFSASLYELTLQANPPPLFWIEQGITSQLFPAICVPFQRFFTSYPIAKAGSKWASD